MRRSLGSHIRHMTNENLLLVFRRILISRSSISLAVPKQQQGELHEVSWIAKLRSDACFGAH